MEKNRLIGIVLVILGLSLTLLGFFALNLVATSYPPQYGYNEPLNWVIFVVGLIVLIGGTYLLIKTKVRRLQ